MFPATKIFARLIIMQIINAELRLCDLSSDFYFLQRDNVISAKANIAKRSSPALCPISVTISSVFHWIRVDISKEPYVIFLRPIPPVFLVAQTKIIGGGDECSKPTRIQWHWTATIDTETINLPLAFNTSRSYFYIFKRYLPNTVVLVTVTAAIGDNVISEMIKVLVYPTPISLVLDGGDIRTVSGRQNLVVLNASRSYDPDRRVDLGAMRFAWFCEVITSKVPVVDPNLERFNPAHKSSGLRQNQESCLPSFIATFNRDNRRARNCGPDLRFDQDGEMLCLGLQNPFTSESGPIIVIKADELSSSHHYIFKVTVTIDSPGLFPQTSRLQELIIIDDEILPNINIRCVYNCYDDHINFLENMVMVSEGEIGFTREMRWQVSHETTAHEVPKPSFFTSVWAKNLFARSQNILYITSETNFKPGETLTVGRNIVTRAGELSLSTVKLNSLSLTDYDGLNHVLCNVEPHTGFTLTTTFSLLCNHMEHLKIINVELYQLFKNTGEVEVLVTGILLTFGTFPIADNLFLAPGNFDNYGSRILIRVILEDYVRKDFLFDLQVKPFEETDLCPSREALVKCLGDRFVFDTKENPSHLKWLITGGHLLEAYSMIHIIARQLNDNDTTLLKMNMRRQMVSFIKGMPIVETSSIVQMALTFFDIFNPIDYAHSVNAQEDALQALVNATWHLYNLNDITLPKMWFIYQAAESCVYAVDHIQHVAMKQREWVRLNLNNSLGITSFYLKIQLIVNLVLMDQIWNNLGNSLLKNELADIKPYSLTTDLFDVYFARQRVKVNADCPVFIVGLNSLSEPSVLPSSFIAIYNSTDLHDQTLDIHIVHYLHNPLYELLEDDFFYDSEILSIRMRQVPSGNYISVFLPPVNIFIATSHDEFFFKNIYSMPFKPYSTYSDEDIFVVRFKASRLSTIFLAVSSLNAMHSLQVVCSSRRPSLNDFSSGHVQVFHGHSWDVRYKPFFGYGNSSCVQSEVFPSQIGIRVNYSQFLYFGILPTKLTVSNILNRGDKQILFYASILDLSCLRFKSNAWSVFGCHPVITAGNNNPRLIHCLCVELSMVTATSRLIPFVYERYANLRFELSVVFNPTILYFLALLALVAIIFLIVGLILCWHLAYQRGVTILKDNDPHYRYSYLVSVHTGYRPKSSTNSFVVFRLLGLNGNSLHFNLEDQSRTILYNGAQDLFLVTSKDSLGVLQGVSILVTPHGKSPDWYLKEIRVYDLLAHHAWMFKANRWIRVKGQEQVQVSLNSKAYTSKEIDNEYSYGDRLVQRFYEDYIFMTSVFSSTASNFTSDKKVFCGVLVVLIALVINLLLRGVPSNSPTQKIGESYFRVHNQDLIWAAITAPILLVFTLLIVYAAKHCCSQWRKWHVFIDYDENWKELSDSWTGVEVETYVVPVDDVTLTITMSNKPLDYLEPTRVKKKNLQRCKVCDINTWCFWGVSSVLCISLLIVIIIFGLRFNVIQAYNWILSSVLGFIWCAFILFPIALLIIAAILPPITSDKHARRVLFHRRLASLFQTRNVIIKRRGSLEEYDLYLNKLRHSIIYQPRQDVLNRLQEISSPFQCKRRKFGSTSSTFCKPVSTEPHLTNRFVHKT